MHMMALFNNRENYFHLQHFLFYFRKVVTRVLRLKWEGERKSVMMMIIVDIKNEILVFAKKIVSKITGKGTFPI